MNNISRQYRHEYKYIISDIHEAILRQRLDALMELDINAKEKGFYTISSMYFDDYNDSCLHDNVNGVDLRKKYRIRIYDNNPAHLYLECKCKERGMTQKTTAEIKMDIFKNLVSQQNSFESIQQTTVVGEMVREIQIKHMKPVVIVTYDRIPYISIAGNVRITIDRNLSSSQSLSQFLTGEYIRRPVMPCGISLLEVKWDSFIPDEIYHLTQMDDLVLTAFSKYALCRKFGV